MLNLLLKNGFVHTGQGFEKNDLLIKDGIVACIGKNLSRTGVSVVDVNNLYIFPGFADVHVHLREPGFSYKETIATGTAAAAKGGFTLVCTMPNLNPVPDSPENMKIQQDIIDKTALIKVLPYASITKGEKGRELVDFRRLRDKCFAFSDDGKGVQNRQTMEKAMEQAKKLGKAIVAHCEDESLLTGGWIHDGEYAALHGHKGISSASEYAQVERDAELAEKTGVQYHVCHISTAQTVDIVRKAKAAGVNISCETAPHYLAFCDMEIEEDGRFKMNPPIRSASDRRALIEGVKDGTIEIIATDHAPHSRREKTKGLKDSSMGVVGLETSFAAMNTYMVRPGHITMDKLARLMSINPRKKFSLSYGIQVGQPADIAVADREKKWAVDPAGFASMGKFTPFEGKELYGEILLTVYNGEIVYNNLTK